MMNNYRKLNQLIDRYEEIDVVFIKSFSNINYFLDYLPTVKTRAFGLFYGQNNTLIVPGTSYSDVLSRKFDFEIMRYVEYPMAKFNSSFEDCISDYLDQNPQVKNIGVEGTSLTFQEMNLFFERGINLTDITVEIQKLRAIKDANELQKIKVAAEFSNQMIANCIRATKLHSTEKDIDEKSMIFTKQEILKLFPHAEVDFFSLTTIGMSRTVLPHTISSAKKVEQGDTLIYCRQTSINGYRAQCDRMVFTAPPTKEMVYYYEIVLEAHQAVLQYIKPGVSVKGIDAKIREVFKKYNVAQYFIHRSGSGIGLEMAEYPMLQFTTDAIVKEGMVLIIQPALYIPGIGGFRISDTLEITDNSCELLTKYPRDIQQLIIPV